MIIIMIITIIFTELIQHWFATGQEEDEIADHGEQCKALRRLLEEKGCGL